MSKKAIAAIAILAGLLLVVLLPMIGSYNRLVSSSEAVDSQWSQVENTYQRRADLIPNLVATVQGAANFERETLESITNARASVGRAQINADDLPDNPEAFQEFQQAQDSLSSALSRLLVVVEAYPELKATQAFRDLQVQLEGTENRIAVERRRYNQVAQEYNTRRQRFPTNVIAGLFGFDRKTYFESTPGSDRPPEVNFGNTPAPSPS
ncbi:MAG: LemA family protein [Actinomycetota bacterium]